MTNRKYENICTPIIFVHIPKTAGTSFRIAANEYFGCDSVLNDYGLEADDTSIEIKQYTSGKIQLGEFKSVANKFEFITGHYQAVKYKTIFPDSPIVTFVREPVSRVKSEYNHYRNLHGYTGSFKDFYIDENFCNRQTKQLDGIAYSDLDFVGITDLYDLSLEQFNRKYGTNMQNLNINKGNYNQNSFAGISEEDICAIIELNQKDIELYNIAKDKLINLGILAA